MKQTFTDISLVVLSVLYLFEVDYRALTVLNWVGFVIVLEWPHQSHLLPA